MLLQAHCLSSSFSGRTAAFRQAPQQAGSGRAALLVQCKESRIGRAPIPVPKGVTVTIDGQLVRVKGPKGELHRTLPEEIGIRQEDGNLRCFRKEESKRSNALFGLSRALTYNMVKGTSDGFTNNLQLFGVGYRAAAQGQKLTLNLGYANPVEVEVPKDISVKVEKNTQLSITCIDKERLGDFCALLRRKRPPEPYKGKGIRFEGEVIKLKEGKRGK